MTRLLNLPAASAATGLTQYQLRAGAKAGRYPYLRAGNEKRGTIMFDPDLLYEAIRRQMMDNMTAANGADRGGGIPPSWPVTHPLEREQTKGASPCQPSSTRQSHMRPP